MQRCLCAVRACRRVYSTALPWFVDEPLSSSSRLSLSPSVPQIPDHTPKIIKQLHTQLAQSPHLDPSSLLVSESIAPPPGPALPLRAPQGRRKRGGTYAGESAYDVPGGVWNWVVTAQALGEYAHQVKEGTENKGAIESVVRVVRKAVSTATCYGQNADSMQQLLTVDPPLPLPPNSKRRMHNGWAMIDAGDFAVHILSKEAREKYFNSSREW
ncbi:hypothetical protein C0995_001959 [Termitomyces sp. Mi166|nr:hypothetical protein C0995_001959 [Termitomyces sp. Mi166\